MKKKSHYQAEIVGTGLYLPEKILTNADLEKTLDTSDEWIRQRTGIRERRVAGEGETTLTLSLQAARLALSGGDVGVLHDDDELEPVAIRLELPRAERSSAADLGEIQLVSEVGAGAMFSLILPITLDETRSEEVKLESAFRATLAGRRSMT